MLTLAVPTSDDSGAAQTFRGGWATVYYIGDFDSGTITLQVSDDAGSNYVSVVDVLGNAIAKTANGYATFYLAGPVLIRNTLSGSSSSTAVVCHVRMGWAATKQGETP